MNKHIEIIRDHIDTQPVQAMLSLLKERMDECDAQWENVSIEKIPELQAKKKVLRGLFYDISKVLMIEHEGKDGGYV